MKLNIYAFDSERIQGGGGYFNLSASDYDNIDDWIDAGECDEIRLNFCLNYLDLGSIKTFMDKIVSKMAYGGKLYASTIDLIETSRAIYFRQLEGQDATEDLVKTANKLLYRGTKNVLSIEYLDKICTNAGLTVLNKRTINYGSHVVAEFPDPTQIPENTHNL